MGFAKFYSLLLPEVTVTWVFFRNPSGESERQHISCGAYCNINPMQQSMERAFGVVHWSFMAMRL